MGVTAIFRSVTDEQLGRARQSPSYAARLLSETPEGDGTPLDSNLSVQRRTFVLAVAERGEGALFHFGQRTQRITGPALRAGEKSIDRTAADRPYYADSLPHPHRDRSPARPSTTVA
jgi:hypothetical protein